VSFNQTFGHLLHNEVTMTPNELQLNKNPATKRQNQGIVLSYQTFDHLCHSEVTKMPHELQLN